MTDFFTMPLYERIIGFMVIGGTAGFLLLGTWKMGMWRFWIETAWDESGKS